MGERLPIWLQAALLVVVSTVLPGTYWWLCKTDQALQGGFRVPNSSYHAVSYMALPVVYLGFSFCYRVLRTENRKTASAVVFLCLGVALTLVAFCVFLTLFFFSPVQRVRDASSLWSSAPG